MNSTPGNPHPVTVPKNAPKPATASPAVTQLPRLSGALEAFAMPSDRTTRGDYRTGEEKSAGTDLASYFDPSKPDTPGKLLNHIFQKLTHEKGLEEAWISELGYRGPLPLFDAAKTDADKRYAADEEWARVLTEIFCYVSYGGMALAYSMLGKGDESAMFGRIVDAGNPSVPLTVACQHLATFLAYTRVFVGGKTPDPAAMPLTASHGSKDCVTTTLGGQYQPVGTQDPKKDKAIDDAIAAWKPGHDAWVKRYKAFQKAHGDWKAIKQTGKDPGPEPVWNANDQDTPRPVPTTVQFTTDKQWYDVSFVLDKTKNGIGVITVGSPYVFNNLGPETTLPDQPSAHVGSILRIAGTSAQTFDTGVMMGFSGGGAVTADKHTMDHGTYKTLPAGLQEEKLIGVGFLPVPDPAKLHDTISKTVALGRPVGCMRFILASAATPDPKDVVYISPMMLAYGSDKKQNFYPSRLAWSLRDLPQSDKFTAMWVLYVPHTIDGSTYELSTGIWAADRSKSLGDLIAAIPPPAQGHSPKGAQFMHVMSIKSRPTGAFGIDRYDSAHGGWDVGPTTFLGSYLGWLASALDYSGKGPPKPFLPWDSGFGQPPSGAPSFFPAAPNVLATLPKKPPPAKKS